MGNVLQAAVGQSPARQAAIKAGLGHDTEATTINKVCLQKVIPDAAPQTRLQRSGYPAKTAGFVPFARPEAVRARPVASENGLTCIEILLTYHISQIGLRVWYEGYHAR